MTSDTQLGRSVLESKERTELQAIAEQLSVKTTSRMKKADLIAEILTAAGVGSEAPASIEATPAARESSSGRPARAKAVCGWPTTNTSACLPGAAWNHRPRALRYRRTCAAGFRRARGWL